MELITLTYSLDDNTSYQAVFSPSQGMNLFSFKRGNIELIDPSTKPAFEERFAGLGPLIGPHFHRRRPELIPKLPDESLFPHIKRCKDKGIEDPFSHGIARYAPWKVEETTSTTIKAKLTGKDVWNGVPLSTIEGQNFSMQMFVELDEKGLSLTLSVVSDTDSLMGIHYYLRLPNGKGVVRSQVQKKCYIDKKLQPIPSDWDFDGFTLVFPLDKEADYTFFPAPDPLSGKIHLETTEYELIVSYQSISQENSWQLYHPKGASFVCIEPNSAQDPRHPNLSVSSIGIQLEILPV